MVAPKPKKTVHKDAGEGDTTHSAAFARQHKEQLKTAVRLKAYFNQAATGTWSKYNVRFFTADNSEFWFSGFNISYKGAGPTQLVKFLKEIHWDINPEVLFINEELEITRLPKSNPNGPKKKKKKGKKKDQPDQD